MAQATHNEQAMIERWRLDLHTRQLTRDGRPADLGQRAFDLLVVLAGARGRVVSTDALLEQVWPGRVVEENNLHVHLSALRKLLGPDAIRTVRGRGYQLVRLLDVGPGAHGETVSPAMPGGSGGLPAASAPTEEREGAAGNLPPTLPPLIGRDADLSRLLGSLARSRSVTLTGAAGVGKTRLALAAAHALAASDTPGRWPAAVWLVELAGVADGTPVAEAVARALGITLPGLQAAKDELLDVLRNRELLLLLDNCEHRAAETADVVDRLVHGCPGVGILATSQVPLQLAGEEVFRLGTLAVPLPQAPPAEALEAGAVTLFCARVAAHAVGFALQGEADPRLADVVAICQRLDGLPLALELAAARVPLLGLAGLRLRLGQQLKLLSGGPRDAPARQQTLRAAIEWSHSLLSDEERGVFRRLGVFAGSFSLALAQQVLAEPAAAGAADARLPAVLQGLVDKSLLVPLTSAAVSSGQASARLRLLESTRSFAREQLQAAGEQEEMARRLAHALLALFRRGDGQRSFDMTYSDVRHRAPELDNLREVLDNLALQPGQSLLQIELAGTSAWIWSRLGLRSEGMRRCRQALDRVDAGTPPALEARLQLAWAALVHRRGAPGDIEAATRAATLYKALGDRLGLHGALLVLTLMLSLAGRVEQCEAALEELTQTFDPSWGEVHGSAHLLIVGTILAQLGRDDEFRACADAGWKFLERDIRDDAVLAPGWIGLAQAMSVFDDFPTAVACGLKGLAYARRGNAGGRLGVALGDTATYLVELGRIDEALPLAREAVRLRAIDGTLGLLLDQLAQLACARGRFLEGALALGRAAVHHQWRHGVRERYLRRPHQRAMAEVAQALAAADLAQALARGAAMGDDEVARLTVAE